MSQEWGPVAGYDYSFDEEEPRYSLRSLWFLLGVMIFAFSVLAMTSVAMGAGSGPTHITDGRVEPLQAQQTAKPTGGRGVNANATPVRTPAINSKGAQLYH